MTCTEPTIRYVGHGTVTIDMDGTRIVTDPVLRNRVAHLFRVVPPPEMEWVANPDAVLISHLHRDHLDVPSLRQLGKDRLIIAPSGGAAVLRGFRRVVEVEAGDSVDVGPVRVVATPAEHSGFRPPFGPRGVPLGYIVDGSLRVYFAGDTDLFPGMADLAGELDVALLPVAGWAGTLGPGHLDPERAAEALTLLRPSMAIPIHWGTIAAQGLMRRDQSFLVDPPQQFAEYAARLASQVAVKILAPGECVSIDVLRERR